MHYRTLGKTGLEVSILGFGASPLGNVFDPVVLGIQAAMLTVAPRARSKAGWVIFFIEKWI